MSTVLTKPVPAANWQMNLTNSRSGYTTMLEEKELQEKAMQVAVIYTGCTVEEMNNIFHKARFKVLGDRLDVYEMTEDERIFEENRRAKFYKEFLKSNPCSSATDIKL